MSYSLAQSCLTLCDPMDCSPPGSSIHGISQARILEWVCHFLLQGIFHDPGIKPVSPESLALASRLPMQSTSATWEAPSYYLNCALKEDPLEWQEHLLLFTCLHTFSNEWNCLLPQAQIISSIASKINSFAIFFFGLYIIKH